MSTLPDVSFVIVTHNEANELNRCLESVLRQNFPSFEIVVVDANSNDKSSTIASRYTSRVIRLNENCLGYSRQIGVDNALGKIVAVIDPDIVLPSDDWLSKAVNAFSVKEKTAIVWPKNVGPSNSNIAKCFFNLWQEIVRHRMKNNPRTFTLGSNACYLKSAIIEVGGFNTELHYINDVDLGRRILAHGYSYVFLEKPIIHYTNMSISEFTRNQILGARDFSKFGIGRLGITLIDALFEHFVLGVRCMIKKAGKEKDLSWLIYPLLLMIRVVSYVIHYLGVPLNRRNT